MDDRAAHRAFRALLLAHAYPGRVQPGPASRAGEVLELLEEAVWADAPRPPVLLGPGDATAELDAAGRGTELEPELGATVVRLAQPGGPRVRVALEGPGVDGRLETSLACSRPELEARARACAGYPLGIDLVFLEPDGGIQALPRTTRVDVLEE
ncbi:MAG TPA: phosphonate C-P lyase system protein PhnH [Candidatus Binatia bacterium]|jgi:alpha-D-ribose 1-methylphosphonate 5-triphosphate synthase subunit PhnH|nr:phosphonate C-P lyase system protein PhnH [Candidatus Binatia bacterium]